MRRDRPIAAYQALDERSQDLLLGLGQVLHVDLDRMIDDARDGFREEQAQRCQARARFRRQSHGGLRVIADPFTARAGGWTPALSARLSHDRSLLTFLFC